MTFKRLKELKKNKKGFTLIEIIVVVVILAVLMAVAIPSVLKYLDEADNAKYMAQGRSVMTMVQTELVKSYVDDKKVTSDELKAITDDANGTVATELKKDGVTVTSIAVYPSDATVTQSGDNITVIGQAVTNFTDEPKFGAVEMIIGEKKIVAVPNGKIYVGE